jgi:hypothetical protein
LLLFTTTIFLYLYLVVVVILIFLLPRCFDLFLQQILHTQDLHGRADQD